MARTCCLSLARPFTCSVAAPNQWRARYIACARLKLVGRFVAEDVGIATGPRSFRLYIMADCHGLGARVRNRLAL
jgi:hypothetical protein